MTSRIDLEALAVRLSPAMRDCLLQHNGQEVPAYRLSLWAGYPAEGSYMAHEAKRSGFFAIKDGINGLKLYPLSDLGLALRTYLQERAQ